MEKTANPVRRPEAKILVVDDRADNLISIEAILEKDNYTIVKANSGRAALKVLLNDHDFSLILMDVQMPELNGYETATIIYERDKLRSIPIYLSLPITTMKILCSGVIEWVALIISINRSTLNC
jgi:CheY-like chemotaxis protein